MAAAVSLAVEPREFDAGVRLIAQPARVGGFVPQVFLADATENGARFVTHLAAPARFDELIQEARRLVAGWEDDTVHRCGSSCPSCLRDWSNLSYHPILDWRLAADVLDILTTGAPTRDRFFAPLDRALAALGGDFGWSVLGRDARGPIVQTHTDLIVVTHALADIDGLAASGVDTHTWESATRRPVQHRPASWRGVPPRI
jgi:hypothetical protein